MRYLGLDLGSRTLGVSISDKTGVIASSYKVIRHNEEYDRLVNDVLDLVKELDIDAIVLGFPKNMDGTVGFKGELSIDFKNKLESLVSIPIILQDEINPLIDKNIIIKTEETSHNITPNIKNSRIILNRDVLDIDEGKIKKLKLNHYINNVQD